MSTLCKLNSDTLLVNDYRPQTKLRKGNFLTPVSQSVHRGVPASMHAGIHPPLGRHTLSGRHPPWADTPQAATPPPGQTPPQADTTPPADTPTRRLLLRTVCILVHTKGCFNGECLWLIYSPEYITNFQKNLPYREVRKILCLI